MGDQLPCLLDIIYNKSASGKHLYLSEHSTSKKLFTVENRSGSLTSAPLLSVLTVGPSPRLIGTASFHKMSSDIELTVHGNAQTIKRHGVFSRPYAMQSFATGAQLQWKTEGLTSDLKLTDVQTGTVLGKFNNASFSLKKQGSLEINAMGSAQLFEEILVSALGVVECRRRAAAATAGASSASSATSAASG